MLWAKERNFELPPEIWNLEKISQARMRGMGKTDIVAYTVYMSALLYASKLKFGIICSSGSNFVFVLQGFLYVSFGSWHQVENEQFYSTDINKQSIEWFA